MCRTIPMWLYYRVSPFLKNPSRLPITSSNISCIYPMYLLDAHHEIDLVHKAQDGGEGWVFVQQSLLCGYFGIS